LTPGLSASHTSSHVSGDFQQNDSKEGFIISSMPVNSQALTSSGFGIELQSLDIANLDDDGAAEILDHFYQAGGLLVVRNQQHISRRQLAGFIALFGSVELNEKYNPAFLEPGYPELLRIGNTKKYGDYNALFIQADPPPLMWHTDDSFRHPQPIGSCLFCLKTPPAGGDTGFAGMQAAYEALPQNTREQIDDLEAIHSYDYLNELLRKTNPHRPPLSDELKKQLPPIKRPLVAQHPVSGKKGLYIPLSHIESIPGLTDAQTRSLLDQLIDHMTQAQFTHMHHWKPGDLVVWDNRSAMHAPTPFDDQKYQRLMYRLTFNGAQILGF
jgi:taurine dioxygenase